MADESFSFERQGVERIVRAVREAEGRLFHQNDAKRLRSTVRAGQSVAVRVVGLRLDNGYYPGQFVGLPPATTTLPPLASTTTTSEPTTTLAPCPTWEAYTGEDVDCWLGVEDEVTVGLSVFSALVVGENDDGIAICIHSKTGCPTTTTTSTTTTTTSTTPAPCEGECVWTWSIPFRRWERTTFGCDASFGCACTAPSFCPSDPDVCHITRTACAHIGYDQPPPDCGGINTTLPPDCPTTTTTTVEPGPDCVTGCDWICAPGRGWVLKNGGCGVLCPCPSPTSPCSECYEVHTPCVQIPPLPVYCLGDCQWVWDGLDPGSWVRLSFGCSSSNVPNCYCDPPQFPGTVCAQLAKTYCYVHLPATTTSEPPGPCGPPPPPYPTTTTTAGTGCNVECSYVNDGFGSWTPDETCPESCDCQPPPDTTPDDCEVVKRPCSGTTTTAGPTTTTTTQTPIQYWCTDQWYGATSDICDSHPGAPNEQVCQGAFSDPTGCNPSGGLPWRWIETVSGPHATIEDCQAVCGTTTTTTTTAAPQDWYCVNCIGAEGLEDGHNCIGVTAGSGLEEIPAGCTISGSVFESGAACAGACPIGLPITASGPYDSTTTITTDACGNWSVTGTFVQTGGEATIAVTVGSGEQVYGQWCRPCGPSGAWRLFVNPGGLGLVYVEAPLADGADVTLTVSRTGPGAFSFVWSGTGGSGSLSTSVSLADETLTAATWTGDFGSSWEVTDLSVDGDGC